MNLAYQAVLELTYRWVSTIAMVLVVAIGVGASLTVAWINRAAVAETKRIQRDLGFNLMVLPADADLDHFRLRGYSDATMAEDVAKQLVGADTVAYNHVVATLTREHKIADGRVLLTGISDTLFPPGKKKPPMSPSIPQGQVRLGSAVADRLAAEAGDALELGRLEVTVECVVAETGGIDDLRVWMELSDAQEVLGESGRISEVRAIDCLCLQPEDDPQAQLRREIARIVPGTQVVLRSQMATARAKQRTLATGLATRVPLLVSISASVTLGALALYNVRQRQGEFAIQTALGVGRSRLLGLVGLRLIVCVLIGSLVGAILAYLLSSRLIPEMFQVTGRVPNDPIAQGFRAGLTALGFSFAASLGALACVAGGTVADELTRAGGAE